MKSLDGKCVALGGSAVIALNSQGTDTVTIGWKVRCTRGGVCVG